MSKIVEDIKLNQLLAMGGNKKCNCNSNSSSAIGFEVAYNSLLNALSRKEKENRLLNTNLILEKEDIKEDSKEDSKLNNNIIVGNTTSNNIEITNNDKNIFQRIENAVKKASKQYGIDENLIKAIIKVESNFNPNTVSSAGAKGLMQLMPENCKDLGVKNPFNIEENIDGGTRHIKEYLDMFDGNVEMALMAYNGGPTRMRKRGVRTPEDIYKMPKETQNYVPKVMKLYRGK